MVLRVKNERDGITRRSGYGVWAEGKYRVGTNHDLVIGGRGRGGGGDGENSGSEREMHLSIIFLLCCVVYECAGI